MGHPAISEQVYQEGNFGCRERAMMQYFRYKTQRRLTFLIIITKKGSLMASVFLGSAGH